MDEKRSNLEGEINALMQLLAATDYKALKHSEGFITDADYAETKALRQSYRDKINDYQRQLDELDQ